MPRSVVVGFRRPPDNRRSRVGGPRHNARAGLGSEALEVAHTCRFRTGSARPIASAGRPLILAATRGLAYPRTPGWRALKEAASAERVEVATRRGGSLKAPWRLPRSRTQSMRPRARIHVLTGSTSAAVINVGRAVTLLVAPIPGGSQTFLRNEERDKSRSSLRCLPQIRLPAGPTCGRTTGANGFTVPIPGIHARSCRNVSARQLVRHPKRLAAHPLPEHPSATPAMLPPPVESVPPIAGPVLRSAPRTLSPSSPLVGATRAEPSYGGRLGLCAASRAYSRDLSAPARSRIMHPGAGWDERARLKALVWLRDHRVVSRGKWQGVAHGGLAWQTIDPWLPDSLKAGGYPVGKCESLQTAWPCKRTCASEYADRDRRS